ncbi:hypothetical protein F751_1861 [Auxenochlorella protothecoides]|uniref:Uncharacterized protein n=1 Tax=Auxenochlorella protothecoides TaxID=3075 RepID=A0A087SGX8_AUXPR|nr:hypothetical protein F751_1861 [Auxenochlorella protothecoides]KFM24982.1 hypothetical protein F751_1861 [Auxenochlorella protothecoides]
MPPSPQVLECHHPARDHFRDCIRSLFCAHQMQKEMLRLIFSDGLWRIFARPAHRASAERGL